MIHVIDSRNSYSGAQTTRGKSYVMSLHKVTAIFRVQSYVPMHKVTGLFKVLCYGSISKVTGIFRVLCYVPIQVRLPKDLNQSFEGADCNIFYALSRKVEKSINIIYCKNILIFSLSLRQTNGDTFFCDILSSVTSVLQFVLYSVYASQTRAY